jgi:hypothetical protein
LNTCRRARSQIGIASSQPSPTSSRASRWMTKAAEFCMLADRAKSNAIRQLLSPACGVLRELGHERGRPGQRGGLVAPTRVAACPAGHRCRHRHRPEDAPQANSPQRVRWASLEHRGGTVSGVPHVSRDRIRAAWAANFSTSALLMPLAIFRHQVHPLMIVAYAHRSEIVVRFRTPARMVRSTGSYDLLRGAVGSALLFILHHGFVRGFEMPVQFSG